MRLTHPFFNLRTFRVNDRSTAARHNVGLASPPGRFCRYLWPGQARIQCLRGHDARCDVLTRRGCQVQGCLLFTEVFVCGALANSCTAAGVRVLPGFATIAAATQPVSTSTRRRKSGTDSERIAGPVSELQVGSRQAAGQVCAEGFDCAVLHVHVTTDMID